MLSWRLLLEDFHKLISWQKVGLDLSRKESYQMVRQLLSSNTNWQVLSGIKNFAQEWNFLVCAQHQNVVMLIGFCIENRRRLMVYEYICTGSLDDMVTNLFPALKCLRVEAILMKAM